MPSRKTPSERGYRQVILSPDAYAKLRSGSDSASASVMKLTSRVEQMEAELAALLARIDQLEEVAAKSSTPFDVEGCAMWLRLDAKATQKLRDFVGA